MVLVACMIASVPGHCMHLQIMHARLHRLIHKTKNYSSKIVFACTICS